MATEIIPRCEMSIRPATLSDLPFMDGLQKKYGKALGYFPLKQFEGYVESGGVLVAVAATPASRELDSTLRVDRDAGVAPTGYIISRDRYLKRDELGVIFQLCVEPGTQRKLVGAALVREVFARSAYGCKLYCCWCAQDLDANYFWESMGFVPVAFRAGSDKKRRVHIFWQKRIDEGDVTTPFWYPFQTNSGAIREDRIVFPIPPGVSWRDVMPPVLPQEPKALAVEKKKRLGGAVKPPVPAPPRPSLGRLSFAPVVAPKLAGEKPKREKKPKAKIDPQIVAKARELRDRYLERFNSGLILPAGKYEVSRALPAPQQSGGVAGEGVKLLPQAA